MIDALVRDLTARLGATRVSALDADRSAYAHDLWPRQLLSTRGGLSRPEGPAAVVWPQDRDELSWLIAQATAQGFALAPFGAGSGVVGGYIAGRDTVAVDLKRMRRLHRVDVAEGVCEADAGLLGEHLEEQLRRRGATLGHFPSSISCSTLGGWIATRSAGQCSGRYGKIEDMTLAFDGVMATGEHVTVTPPREGRADPRALWVGSEGTFGFITRATMRVWPAPTTWRGVAYTFRTMRDAWETIRAMYQSGLRPAVTRLYDPLDSYVFLQGGAKPSGRAAPPRTSPAAEYLLRHVLDHPRGINAALDVVSTRVYTRSLLIAIFEGADGEPYDDLEAAARAHCRAHGGRDEGDGPPRRWLARRHAVSYRQPPTFARGAWVDTMEVAAPWSRLEALYDGVREALGGGGLVMAHMSHAYPDGCSIYFTFVGGSPDDATARDTYDATWARALRAAHAAGGTIAHHHGVGRSKRAAMGSEWGAGLRVMESLRRAADPKGVLARGPLVPPEFMNTDTTSPVPRALDVDATSRLVRAPVDASGADVARALAAHGLSLPGLDGAESVASWLRAAMHASPSPTDPVDHLVAGWSARTPGGAPAWWLAAPRRAAGPDILPLLLHDARFGALDTVTLRARGDEPGPARAAAGVTPTAVRDASLDAWIDRAAAEEALR